MKKILTLYLVMALTGLNIVFASTTNKGHKTMKKIIQTAGRDRLGDFAPDFAHFNDDILFGENWNNNDIDTKTRSIITVVALISQGITDSSLQHHLQNAKNNGVTKEEIAAIITNTAFYAGWPKAWATFNLAKEVWGVNTVGNDTSVKTAKEQYAESIMFPIGEPNTAYAKYFVGQSYLASISTSQVKMFNVTFEPGCRNNWHIHHAKSGGGQILVVIGGRGYYQEWGRPARELKVGDVVNIPAGVKHWHGAASDSWFSHIAVEVEGTETSNEWLEAVTDEEYNKLK
ncbi:MAG: carboxymuconolactone decarboxylase family protein [Candidatus Gastranaerophilales bacterium]|nr:carboxymuconolactone decarboxylase family protein [Candidatus Gastranaerophilales bacterium]